MTGWARFFLLLVCCVTVLVLWPQYDAAGLLFMGMAFLLWTCVIILLSVLSNIFGVYKFEFLNRLVSIMFLGALLASLLFYFPLKDNQTPALLLKQNVWPTLSDAKQGLNRLTFNFDFVRRNVKRDANYVNQKLDGASEKTKELKKTVKKQKEKLDIIVEQLEGEE